MRKLLVTGGSGDLGRVVCERAAAAGFEVIAGYLTRAERIRAGTPYQLDLTDRDAVQEALDELQPEAIIHTATPPIGAPNLRQQIVTSAYHLSSLADKRARVILLSSDMVFDGTTAPYRDDDPPSPLSIYGQAKAEMEMMGDQVARTSLIYDFEPTNKQVAWMMEKIKKGERLRLFSDEFRSAIWAVNLADALLELLDKPFKGVLNVAGPEAISRLELGWRLLESQGIDPEPHVEVVSQAQSGRPADLTLDVSKAQMLLKTPLLTLEEAYTRWQAEKVEQQ